MRSAAVLTLMLSGLSPASASPADDLLNTDRQVAAYAHDHGFVTAFTRWMSPTPRKFDQGSPPALGLASVVRAMSAYRADLEISWVPAEAVVADSGELGFTWGRYVASYGDGHGGKVTEYGKYLDVWRKQPDGSWKWIADIGNTSPPPQAEPAQPR